METAARMGVLSTFYLRHAYGRDSPGLHEEDIPVTKNGHTPSAKREDVISNSEVHLSKKLGPLRCEKIIRVNAADSIRKPLDHRAADGRS